MGHADDAYFRTAELISCINGYRLGEAQQYAHAGKPVRETELLGMTPFHLQPKPANSA